MSDEIKKGLSKRVLDTLKKMQKDQPEDYQKFWKEFGLVIKEGPGGHAAAKTIQVFWHGPLVGRVPN